MYLLFDTEVQAYCGKAFGSVVRDPARYKTYQVLAAAIARASLQNIPRSLPEGYVESHKYSVRPPVVVHEVDTSLRVIKVHEAPPSYIKL